MRSSVTRVRESEQVGGGKATVEVSLTLHQARLHSARLSPTTTDMGSAGNMAGGRQQGSRGMPLTLHQARCEWRLPLSKHSLEMMYKCRARASLMGRRQGSAKKCPPPCIRHHAICVCCTHK